MEPKMVRPQPDIHPESRVFDALCEPNVQIFTGETLLQFSGDAVRVKNEPGHEDMRSEAYRKVGR